MLFISHSSSFCFLCLRAAVHASTKRVASRCHVSKPIQRALPLRWHNKLCLCCARVCLRRTLRRGRLAAPRLAVAAASHAAPRAAERAAPARRRAEVWLCCVFARAPAAGRGGVPRKPGAPPTPRVPRCPCARSRLARVCQTPPQWREEWRGRVQEYPARPDGGVSASAEQGTPSAAAVDAAGGAGRLALADAARDFLLPPGFPASVSGDYIRYAALSFPSHATGALQGALATAALLHGVGLGAAATAPGAPPALSAAVKWVSKDGLGAAGRLAVAGRVAAFLDAEPRQWRMYAEAAALAGGALDVATALAPPAAFLPLAAAGTALRACGKAVAAPAHQVILAHFARSGNLGAVAAKEEVQEVLAQLLGLAASVALLQQPALKDDMGALAAAWAAASAVHVTLRYAALSGLRFAGLNARRAAHAAQAHAAGEPRDAWAGIEALNAREAAAVPWAAPRLALGVRLGDALEAVPAAQQPGALAALATALRAERFIITWRPGAAWVVLRAGATPRDALRAARLSASLIRLPAAADAAALAAQLALALPELDASFEDFQEALLREGWNLESLLPAQAASARLLDAAEDGAAAAAGERQLATAAAEQPRREA